MQEFQGVIHGPNETPEEIEFWDQVIYGDDHWIFKKRRYMGEISQKYAWRSVYGDPGKYYVLNACDNRKCVHPMHIYLGTKADFLMDMAQNERYNKETEDGTHLTRGDAITIHALLISKTLTRRQIARMYGIKNAEIDAIVKGKIHGFAKRLVDRVVRQYG